MIRKIAFLCAVLLMAAGALRVAAQSGARVVCPDGQVIDQGVEIIVNMRPGFTYTATAIGIDGFDPVLAVSDEEGTSLCADDDPAAASYSADLPTTGLVPASSLSSQVPFSHTYDDLHDIFVTVGGFGHASGEVIVVLEGLAVTSADGTGEGSGDPFSLHVTPNLVASGVPIGAYMISVNSGLDPFMKIMDDDNRTFQFDDGSYFACDDAGQSNLCWGESSSLVGSYVSRTQGRQLPGGELDAMMMIPVVDLGLEGEEDGYFTWRMSSSNNETFGDYLVVFHLGIGKQAAGVLDSAGNLHQWAASAEATSQYTDTSWNAMQASGAANTSACGDIDTAWASASSTGADVLTVNFAEPVIPSQVNIYQTYNPGSIIRVDVASRAGGPLFTLPNSADPPGNTKCPGIFSVDVDDVTGPVDQVIIYLDQSIGGSWNEIDAVELIGTPVRPSDG